MKVINIVKLKHMLHFTLIKCLEKAFSSHLFNLLRGAYIQTHGCEYTAFRCESVAKIGKSVFICYSIRCF